MKNSQDEKTFQCVFSKRSPLCKALEDKGVPPEPRWWTLSMHLMGLEHYDFMSLKQKAQAQTLMAELLHEKDFSDRRFAEASAMVDAIHSEPTRKKLESVLRESAGLVKEFEDVLGRRVCDVSDLEGYAVDTVRAGGSPEEVIDKLRMAFRELVRSMEEDSRQLEDLARTDALTQLYNRRGYEQYMEQLVPRLAEKKFKPSMLMIDIDRFKHINDTYGHIIGDQTLKVVAGKIRQCLSDKETGRNMAFRFGGEEFLVVIEDRPLEEVWNLAEFIRKTIERYNFVIRNANGDILHKGVKFTVSVGVAQGEASWGATMMDRLLEAADAALYNAKRSGRNRVSLFEPSR